MIYDYWKHRMLRELVLKRDKNQCVYCQQPLDITTATVDHIIPTSRGGQGNVTNLCACCRKCNDEKGSLLPLEFVVDKAK
jgi:5-methylcytosine-specific restriction endonuclease McrA